MFRTDYKYALVEEYKNYWNGYQNANEFYSDLLTLDLVFNKHFTRRKMQAKGQSAITEIKLIDQNTIWFILYGRTKRALDCLKDYNEKDINYKCNQNRIISSRNIIKIT